jgi:hypothetical protein
MNGSIIRLASIHGERKRPRDIEMERDLEAILWDFRIKTTRRFDQLRFLTTCTGLDMDSGFEI